MKQVDLWEACRLMLQESNPTSTPSLEDAKTHASAFLDKPYVTGGSFRSGCSQERLTQATEHLPETHPLRGALPKSEPKKTNTIRQIERTISSAFRDCITTITSDRASHLVHISSPMSNGEINLSEHRIRCTLTFEGDTLKSVDMHNLSNSEAEVLQLLEQAIYDAENVLNSTAWQIAYKHLHAAVGSLSLWTGSYLVQTQIGEWMVDQWSAIARECGQPVGRADRPAEVAQMSLEEQVRDAIKRANDKAQSASKKGIAAETNAVVDLLAQIKNLKTALGMATGNLEVEANKALALWNNVSQQAQAQAQAEERWMLTKSGLALLDRVRQDPIEYLITDKGNVLTKTDVVAMLNRCETAAEKTAFLNKLVSGKNTGEIVEYDGQSLKTILERCESRPLKQGTEIDNILTIAGFVKAY